MFSYNSSCPRGGIRIVIWLRDGNSQNITLIYYHWYCVTCWKVFEANLFTSHYIHFLTGILCVGSMTVGCVGSDLTIFELSSCEMHNNRYRLLNKWLCNQTVAGTWTAIIQRNPSTNLNLTYHDYSLLDITSMFRFVQQECIENSYVNSHNSYLKFIFF